MDDRIKRALPQIFRMKLEEPKVCLYGQIAIEKENTLEQKCEVLRDKETLGSKSREQSLAILKESMAGLNQIYQRRGMFVKFKIGISFERRNIRWIWMKDKLLLLLLVWKWI